MGFLDWVRGVNEKLEPEGATVAPTVPTEHDILNALDRTEELAAAAQLNPVVLARVRRVAGGVRETLPRMNSLGFGSSDSYAVMATATDYLPEALGAYLRLPRDWADSRPIEAGKTSLMLLIDQLDLLGATMDKIFDAVVRSDAEALVAHGRFLTARFGGQSSGGELELNTTQQQQPSAPAPSHAANPLELP